ncbi:MAG TPA: hypothetical protein VHS78_20620 [Candidatus Elarobacter sp.]|jgi:C-terminal processing protease CtpA/Prc|nr:hypothetical protein [Candidatus Elarobacter sp.]
MGDVNLPVLDAGSTLDEAFDALRRHGSSALVVEKDGRHELVFGGALLRAEDAGKRSLREVEGKPVERREALAGDVIIEHVADGISFGNPAVRGVTRGIGGRRSGKQPAFTLERIAGDTAQVRTARDRIAAAIARPDLFRCSIVRAHAFPDPDVDDGEDCPSCIDEQRAQIGVVTFAHR